MKTLLLTFFLAAAAFAQPAVVLTIKVGAQATQSFTLPPALVTALIAAAPTQTKLDPSDVTGVRRIPVTDAPDALIAFLKESYFRPVMASQPSAAVTAAIAAVRTAEQNLAAAMAAANLP